MDGEHAKALAHDGPEDEAGGQERLRVLHPGNEPEQGCADADLQQNAWSADFNMGIVPARATWVIKGRCT